MYSTAHPKQNPNGNTDPLLQYRTTVSMHCCAIHVHGCGCDGHELLRSFLQYLQLAAMPVLNEDKLFKFFYGNYAYEVMLCITRPLYIYMHLCVPQS